MCFRLRVSVSPALLRYVHLSSLCLVDNYLRYRAQGLRPAGKRRRQNGWERDARRGVGPRDDVLLLERGPEAGRVIALRVAFQGGERRSQG